MTRDHVVEIVKQKAARALDNFSPDDFDESKTLPQLGIDSLALVEIIAGSTKELKLKIPRHKFGAVKDVGGLIDLLWNHCTHH